MVRLIIRSAVWMLPGLVLLAFWKVSFWAFSHFGCGDPRAPSTQACFVGSIDLRTLAFIGWWCMLLWLPVLLAGIADTGLTLQKQLRQQHKHVWGFDYRDALHLSPTAAFIWLAVTSVGTVAALFATYPDRPDSLVGWLKISCPWLPVWLLLSWLRNFWIAKRPSVPNAERDA